MPKIIDTEHTGFFRDPADGTVYRVRHNRRRTARYTEALLPVHPGIRTDYRGQAPLHTLTPDDELGPVSLLRFLAAQAPHRKCLFCHRPVEDPPSVTFGIGPDCAARHLEVPAKVLRVLHTRLDPPPDGGQPTPRAVHRGHLRLVAAYGRLIDAA